ncbi:hypothetical protein BWQ96_00684 [Gracilariopsis chorda]|uniref:Uncharacterized protein n=1 Tax=Gracilariopsis chorda TaxID=448386 RepID=A0A2V3J5G1_9FLOR|nr:hypothetical protein BWQ96_00684 [Gracilariopsis chorda]|eukprot:PXF49614.1 hypothetical protein BWQ96_00684 [Gracilariopsis chorda]
MNPSSNEAQAQAPPAQQEPILSILSSMDPVAPHLPFTALVPARAVQIQEHPPTTTQTAIPQFRNLRSKDPAFFLKRLSVSQLKEILQSAPSELRTSLCPFPFRDQLLGDVLRLHDLEASAATKNITSTDRRNLDTLMKMSPDQGMALARERLDELKVLMKSSVIADSSLKLRSVPESNPFEAAAVAISWLLSAVQQLQSGNSQPNQANNQHILASATSLSGSGNPLSFLQPSPKTAAANINSDNSEDDAEIRPAKKAKPVVNPKSYYIGMANAYQSTLARYPGKRNMATSLNIDDLIGPAILSLRTYHGTDIMKFLLHHFQHWKRPASGLPTAQKMEAISIGRMTHLEILIHDSARQALEQRPSLQVGLRRLYAILCVQEDLSNGVQNDRRNALEEVHCLFEVVP